jgi:hypothetical protein
MVNKKACQFSYVDRIINIDVPVAIKKPLIEIAW